MIYNTRQLIIFFSIYLVLVIAAMGVAVILEDSETVAVMQTSVASAPVDIKQNVIKEVIHYFNPHLTDGKQLKISRSIMDQAKKFNLEPFFVAGVIATESSFRPGVVSRCKARGLMQITDIVSSMMDVKNPFDIEQNIYAGAKYLKMLQQRFEKEELVLAAYNAGPTRVARLRRVPKIRETMRYITRVIQLKEKLNSMFQARIERSLGEISLSLIAWSAPPARENSGHLTASGLGSLENILDCDGPRRLFVIQA